MNKKTIIGIMGVCVVIVVIGVMYFMSSSDEDLNNQIPNIIDGNTESLVVYFSVPETDNPNNMTQDEENSTVVVDGEVLGNTQYVASLISERTNSDLFRLEPVDTYPTNHEELLERAMEEMTNGVRHTLKEEIDISSYDIIFIGYPIWNADLPPIINTFLETNDFTGKTVIPFCTHGGSGLAGTPRTKENKLSSATVITNGFSLSRTNMESAPEEVDLWLSKIGF